MGRRKFLRDASGAAVVTLAGCGPDPPRPPFQPPTPPPPPPAPTIEVFSHYCNWLKKTSSDDSWTTTTQWPEFPSNAGYDSFDETVLDHQDELMRHYGIVPLFSWWGPDGEGDRAYGGDNFLRAWLANERVAGGLLYEAGSRLRWNKWGWIDFDWTHNRERFIQDIEYLSGTFFSTHPERFYAIDGRPVIFLWLSHIYTGKFDEVVAQVRDKAYFVGGNWRLFGPDHDDYAHPHHPHRHPFHERVIQSFDALSGYGIYEAQFVEEAGGELNEQLLGHIHKVADDWVDYLTRFHEGKPIWLPLQFTFNDTLVEEGRSNPVLRCTLEQAERLAATWRERIHAALDAGGPETTRVVHVSFNEHFEGSAVEPFVYNPDAWPSEGYPDGEEYLRIFTEVLNAGTRV